MIELFVSKQVINVPELTFVFDFFIEIMQLCCLGPSQTCELNFWFHGNQCMQLWAGSILI